MLMKKYNTIAVEGTQYGDEGKGKITDFLAENADVVVRYQGGNNAGHSIVINNERHDVRSLPSGIFNPHCLNVIANGVVLNPFALLEEIDKAEKAGLKFKLAISDRAHLILPYHMDLDGAYENLLGDHKIGTTKRGIGPCYADKARRIGIRVCDLKNPAYLKERLTQAVTIHNFELKGLGLGEYDADELYAKLLIAGKRLLPYIEDTSIALNEQIHLGRKVLFEGAQGALLDLDHGTYPFVTSSSPSAASIPVNCGIPPKSLNRVVGVVKAYMTRVGAGPMPSELTNELGDRLREKGHEYGVVTHRPRRVGYLDLPVVKQAVRIAGIEDIAVTLFDVLSEISPLKICIGYTLDGKEIEGIPACYEDYLRCQPIFKEFKTIPDYDIASIHKLSDLPKEAQDYLAYIADCLNVRIAILSLGPDREQTIQTEPLWND